MSKQTQKEITVACPKCQKKFDYYSSPFRPFCCERCKLIDFGHWMNETYTVPVKIDPLKNDESQDQEYETDSQENTEDE